MSSNQNDGDDGSLNIAILLIVWLVNLFIFFTNDLKPGGLSLPALLTYLLWIAGIFLCPVFILILLFPGLPDKIANLSHKLRIHPAMLLLLFAIVGFFLYRLVTVTLPLRNADYLASSGKYDEAIQIYRQLEYKKGLNLHDKIGAACFGRIEKILEDGDVSRAVKIMTTSSYDDYDLGDTNEFRRRAAELLRNNEELYKEMFSPGVIIPMGRYRSDSNPEMKSSWFILDIRDRNVLLILKGGAYPWHTNRMYGPNWEASRTRTALNDSMYHEMFTDSERASIQLTTLKNTIHKDNKVVEGNNTQDYIFLLSKEEVEHYQKVLPPEKMDSDGWRSYGGWWTRTVADIEEVRENYGRDKKDCSGYMLVTGTTSYRWGGFVASNTDYDSHEELLPAMWVNIDSLLQSWL